jgi:hypothetical protein
LRLLWLELTLHALKGTVVDVAGYRHVTIRMDRLVEPPAVCTNPTHAFHTLLLLPLE